MKELAWHRNRDRTNAPRFCAYGERGIYSIASADGVLYLTVFTYGVRRVAQTAVASSAAGKAAAARLDSRGPRYDERSRLGASIRRYAEAAVAP
jgi:hypothetical protein